MANLPSPKRNSWNSYVKPKRQSQETDQFYNSKAWRGLSKLYRQRNPLCEHCKRNNIIKPAAHVDHIKEIKDGGEPLDWENLQSLCVPCHSRKTSAERINRGKQV